MPLIANETTLTPAAAGFNLKFEHILNHSKISKKLGKNPVSQQDSATKLWEITSFAFYSAVNHLKLLRSEDKSRGDACAVRMLLLQLLLQLLTVALEGALCPWRSSPTNPCGSTLPSPGFTH